MSTINTNGINVNYPVPGVNNNSQGFRDNFNSIKNNLNTAATEITDLENKVVVKQALTDTTLNNDMANTLISNASTRSFRATTYNLGNAISGTIRIDVSLGDVQYGTIAGNTTIQFGNWAPTGTQSNVQLQLNVSNANAVITFPSEVVFANNNFGVTTLENYSNIANTPTVSIPYGVSVLDYRLSTLDCGNTITIEPFNRPRISTQVQTRTPAPTGFPGDVTGTMAVDPSVNQLTLTSSNASDYFTTTGNTTQLYPGMAVVFTGTSFEANITAGTTYYVRNVVSSTTFTVASSSALSSNVNLSGSSGNMYLNPVTYFYVATDDYNSTTYSKTVSNTTVTTDAITLNNTTSLVVNSPIIFTGTTFGGLSANTVYYIKTISSPNITVSATRTNGVADSAVTLSTASGSCVATIYVGNDIWKRIPLNSW
jgi:hypothetical protein